MKHVQSIRNLCIAAAFLASPSVSAAELSPWLGSTDQSPFQLDPHTMVAVTFAADPLQTGSTTKLPCQAEGCTAHPKAAKPPVTAAGTPQN